jgi:hypothetical protein
VLSGKPGFGIPVSIASAFLGRFLDLFLALNHLIFLNWMNSRSIN